MELDEKNLRSKIHACHDHLKQHGLNRDLEDLAYTIVKEALKKSDSDDEFKLGYFNQKNAFVHTDFKKVPGKRPLKDDADPETRKRYIRDKAKELLGSDILKGLSKELKEKVIKKVADNNEYLVTKYEDLEFSDEECVVIRNYINVSTNAMYRMKQVLEVLRPELKGKLYPPSLRVIFQQLENNGVVPAITKRIELQVSGDETKRAMRTYYYVSNPGAILELQTVRSILDGTYQQSFDICNFSNKTIMCWGIDKSDTDLNCAQRVCNRINGNSSTFVQGIASAEKLLRITPT